MSTPDIPTPDFESYSMARPLERVTVEDGEKGVVQVIWVDGYVGRFHMLWLRDNCACDRCVDAGSRERLYGILDVPTDVHPLSAEVSEQGGLQIIWSQDNHHSHYHPGWLRAFCYSDGLPLPQAEYELWDRTLEDDLPIFDAQAVLNDRDTRYEFLLSVQRKGLALVTNMPPDKSVFETLATSVGLLRDMNWGKIFSVITNPEGEYLANRAHALSPHTDASTREYQPGIQIFQCVENTTEGGESVWVDGFYVAHLMRERHPEAYTLLSTVPWEKANRARETHYRWNAPVIVADQAGKPIEIRDIHWLDEPLRASFDTVPALYRAYRLWAELTHNRAHQVERKLVKGDLAVVDNRRVLHARRSFLPETGLRHIRTCYTEREELASSLRMIERARQSGQATKVSAGQG